MNDDDPFLSEQEAALRKQLAELQVEHSDLDAAILALGLLPVPDQMMIVRLKRKKLMLRDEIEKIRDQILPDIIA